ncbi:hypothetical protein [uncultured Campylobacter sp.]|uniref:hypothetical protein n=1 Tax=uncultured Campylobacter sp. TaxID=218934 RepID=UPI002603FB07|nr:hypothetical protein [uncultured Campylobacter sp.]
MANELNFDDMKFKTYMNFALNERFSFSFQAEFKILAQNYNLRILKFFELSSEKNLINLDLQNWRSWKEAKAT